MIQVSFLKYVSVCILHYSLMLSGINMGAENKEITATGAAC
jgi:hypothetical protein